MRDLVNIIYYAEKISTHMMTEVNRSQINEYFVENSTWFRMREDFPEMNLLENEALFEELQKSISQEM